MDEKVLEKLKILAESAKYDVSCASSGTSRSHKSGAIGSAAGWGICHSFAEDGRCISLLKIMLTNYCMYDCAYCINRRSNDLPRATLSVTELVNITIEFYRRNYIEGLFLSSGVVEPGLHDGTVGESHQGFAPRASLQWVHTYEEYPRSQPRIGK